MNFEQIALHTLITEDNIQPEVSRDTVDPTVFQTFENGRPPRLHDSIKAQIITDVTTFEYIVSVLSFYITGDILSQYYTPTTEIAVMIEVDPQIVDNIATAEVMLNLNKLNGRLAVNTRHPINYYILVEEGDINKMDAVYDVVNERWAKLPESINRDLEVFLTKISETMSSIDINNGKLRRMTIDFDDLSEWNDNEIEALRFKIQKQYDALNEVVKTLVASYKNDEALIHLADDDTLSKDDIITARKLFNISENFVLKLYEKYFYRKFMTRLDDILTKNDDFDIQNLMNSKIGKKYWRSK